MGINLDLHAEAGVQGGWLSGDHYLVCIGWQPDGLPEALLERGGLFGVKVAGAVMQGNVALLTAELDGDGVELAVSRSLGRKAQQISGMAVLDHIVQRGSDAAGAPEDASAGRVGQVPDRPLDGMRILLQCRGETARVQIAALIQVDCCAGGNLRAQN